MRMRSLAGALMFAACTGGASSQSAVTAPSSPVPWPSAPPVASVHFSCTLPVWSDDGGHHANAFIQFPAGVRSPAGEGGYYYDRVVARWLPVRGAAVSPDGRRFAYTEGWSASPPAAPRVHIADAATGADLRTTQMPEAQPFGVAAFSAAGVYLSIAYEGVSLGVWLADPDTGKVTKVSDGYYEPAGAAWIGVVDPRDPKPPQSLAYGFPLPNRIDRRDDTGAITTWFYRPGFEVEWVAFDGSQALLVKAMLQDIAGGQYSTEYWLVDGPGRATRLAAGSGQVPLPYVDLESGFGSAVADNHGIWIGGQKALYLIRRDGAITQVFQAAVTPAGSCH